MTQQTPKTKTVKKGYKRYNYDNGLPFQGTLDTNIIEWKDRVLKKNKAAMIIIDGGVGEGKTTLSVHIADFINGAYEKQKDGTYKTIKNNFIDFKKQLSMGGEDFRKKLKGCFNEHLPVCIYDEAGDFEKRGSLTRFNAEMNRVFETYRAFKVVVILTLPSFKVLDNHLLDKQIARALVHCRDRNNFYGAYNGYSLYRMFYIQEKMKKLIVSPFAYNLVQPNFRGNFLDLLPARAQELDKLTTKGKLGILDEVEVKGYINYAHISKYIGRSIVWVKKKVNQLGIIPAKTHKNKAYFEKNILETLNKLKRGS